MKKTTKRVIFRVNRWLNKPTTVILILALLFAYFAYGNAQFNKVNQQLLRDTSSSVQNTERIIKDLQTAVTDLKADNGQQTLILCKIIISGSVAVQGQDAAEIEHICQERIRAQGNEPTGTTSTTNEPVIINLDDLQGVEVMPPSTQPQEPTPEPEPETPSLLPFGCITGLVILGRCV